MNSNAFRFAALLVIGAFLSHPAAGQTVVTGDITQDATWPAAVTIQGTARVMPGVVLTISPGTIVRMRAAAVLEVNGRLLADGSEAAADPVHP